MYLFKKIVLLTCIGLSAVPMANAASKLKQSTKPVPDKSLASPDHRKGVLIGDLTTSSKDIEEDRPTVESKPLYSELFKPSLPEWIKANGAIQYTSSGLIHERDIKVDRPTKLILAIPPLAELQYFYRQSLHAELTGKNAKDILDYTHSKGGRVFVSTRFNKIYDPKEFVNETDNIREYSQCVDIAVRITVTKVPFINNFGVQSLIDYWQDFEMPVCHTNSDES